MLSLPEESSKALWVWGQGLQGLRICVGCANGGVFFSRIALMTHGLWAGCLDRIAELFWGSTGLLLRNLN